MNRKKTLTPPELDWHILFLGRIYSFTGWLGLLGGVFMLLSLGQAQESMFGMPPVVATFLLIGWSSLLLSFSGDIQNEQSWTTGIGGWLIGAFHLISAPIGTAIGLYTLYVLFRHKWLTSHAHAA